jgi:hypothetical protein
VAELYSFFNLGARRSGGEHHTPSALPQGKRNSIHCIGGWVILRAGLDGCGKSHPLGAFSTQVFGNTEISNQTRCQGIALWLRPDANTGMRRITMFRSTTDRIYDGGP